MERFDDSNSVNSNQGEKKEIHKRMVEQAREFAGCLYNEISYLGEARDDPRPVLLICIITVLVVRGATDLDEGIKQDIRNCLTGKLRNMEDVNKKWFESFDLNDLKKTYEILEETK